MVVEGGGGRVGTADDDAAACENEDEEEEGDGCGCCCALLTLLLLFAPPLRAAALRKSATIKWKEGPSNISVGGTAGSSPERSKTLHAPSYLRTTSKSDQARGGRRGVVLLVIEACAVGWRSPSIATRLNAISCSGVQAAAAAEAAAAPL